MLGIREVNFRKAHFETGVGVQEQWIVSATGNLIVTWNLKTVRRGKLFDYKLKLAADSVVANQFRYDHADEVVVTLPDDVLTARRHNRRQRSRRL